MHIANKVEAGGLAAWFLSLMICLGIYVGGVSDQLQFGRGNICLLYVNNYHLKDKNDNNSGWIFDSTSTTCGTAVSFGLLSCLALIVLAGFRFFYIYKQEEPTKKVVYGFLAGGILFSLLSMFLAILVTAGVSQTCTQFVKGGKSCGAVFGAGFYAGDPNVSYTKNINTINSAIGASWVALALWIGYSAFEFYKLRYSSIKWW
ncbi:hypothetical protein HDV06_002011 [Boothiomyces sp. JEL0866]|nr:hypothetical protein HDV06_002011 [Boothiomyces sp. JEL0866]